LNGIQFLRNRIQIGAKGIENLLMKKGKALKRHRFEKILIDET